MVLIEAALIASTVGLTYVTGVPYGHRKRHLQWCRHYLVLIKHHGKWLLWEITVRLPRKRG